MTHEEKYGKVVHYGAPVLVVRPDAELALGDLQGLPRETRVMGSRRHYNVMEELLGRVESPGEREEEETPRDPIT